MHVVWIMEAVVPSASPSQEAECAPVLTTRLWRRTMSPVQVGGHNESDGTKGLRSSSASTVILASSYGTKIKSQPFSTHANLLINKFILMENYPSGPPEIWTKSWLFRNLYTHETLLTSFACYYSLANNFPWTHSSWKVFSLIYICLPAFSPRSFRQWFWPNTM